MPKVGHSADHGVARALSTRLADAPRRYATTGVTISSSVTISIDGDTLRADGHRIACDRVDLLGGRPVLVVEPKLCS